MKGLVEVTLMAGALLAAATWVIVVLCAPRRGRGPKGSPARRLLVARAWLFAPIWLPLALVGAAMAPGVIGALARYGDHCLAHGAGHHHHLCLLHPPHPAGEALAWALPLLVLAPAVFFASMGAGRVWRRWRLEKTLAALGAPSPLGPDVRVLDRPEPLALTVGARRPVVVLSQGLLARVSTPSLAAILAHERAHARRRDPWLALFDHVAASLLPPSVAGPLLAHITLAREQACDAVAAAQLGDPIIVARALAEVLRLEMVAPAAGVSVASGDVEARVAALLGPTPTGGRGLPLAALLVAVTVVGAWPLHSAIERLITALVH